MPLPPGPLGLPGSLAELLRQFRIQASSTQEELAEQAGISPDAIAAIEPGRRRPPRLSTVTGVTAAVDLHSSERSRPESDRGAKTRVSVVGYGRR